MSNVLNLPQVPAFAFVVSVDGDWLDSIFFPADMLVPPTPLDLSNIRFRCDLKNAATGQTAMLLDTIGGTLLNSGTTGYLSFNLLALTRAPFQAGSYTADLFAIADGYQRNLSESSGSMTVTIKGDTL